MKPDTAQKPERKPPAKHYHGHRTRLRARFADAPEKLQDYEILELLLGYVLLRTDTKPVAKALLERFGTLRGVVGASPESCADIPGVGAGVSTFLALLKEFIPRYAESPVMKREVLCSPQAVAGMAKERLGKLQHEEIWAAFVNNSNQLLDWEKVSTGSTFSATLHPRDVVARALALEATGFILVHNHPGGSTSPSGNDLELTRKMDEAARALGIRFLDHLIVTEGESYSLADNNLM